MLFTTREPLPAPFHHTAREIVLGALSVTDAKALVMQVMNNEGLHLRHDDQGNTPQEVDDLVGSVGCHARALVLLARELAQRGVKATTANVRAIMQELEQRHPRQRELSLFASVELSLRRLSPEVREQIAGLAVFQDGGNYAALVQVLDVDTDQVVIIIKALIEVGLAQPIGDYGYIRLDPALPATLDLGLTAQQREGYRQRWREVMGQLVGFLYQQQFKDTKLAAQLTQLELPNLMAYLRILVQTVASGQAAAETLADKTDNIETLLAQLNQPQALAEVVCIRQKAAQHLSEWSHARYRNENQNIERLLQQGTLQPAYEAALALLQQCQQAGKQAYTGADYDLASAYFTLGRILKTIGVADQAKTYLQEAQLRFDILGDEGKGMAYVALSEQGDCLRDMGQMTAAVDAYEKSIQCGEQQKNIRHVAAVKFQLATTCMLQKRYKDALKGYQAALELFTQLDEPSAIGGIWYQIGMVHWQLGDYPQTEQAYRQALSIQVTHCLELDKAASLGALGSLYDDWDRLEQAVSFSQQAIDLYVLLRDQYHEGVIRGNLAGTLVKLGSYDEARLELQQALQCKQKIGSTSDLWKTWGVLYDLELASGNPQAVQKARQQVLEAYLTYRRGGGEIHSGAEHLCLLVGEVLKQKGDTTEIKQVINQLLRKDDWDKKFLSQLQVILAGERNLALVDDETLHYQSAVELLLLLEGLREAGLDSPLPKKKSWFKRLFGR